MGPRGPWSAKSRNLSWFCYSVCYGVFLVPTLLLMWRIFSSHKGFTSKRHLMQLKMKTRKFSQKTCLGLKSGNFFNIKVKIPQCLNQYQKQCLIQYQYQDQYILILTDFINQYQYSPKDLGNIKIKINIPQMPFLISISRSIYLDIDLDF